MAHNRSEKKVIAAFIFVENLCGAFREVIVWSLCIHRASSHCWFSVGYTGKEHVILI